MTWQGSTDALKAALSEAHADWRWVASTGQTAFRIGPDLPDEMPTGDEAVGISLNLPVVPIGKTLVNVADHAVYYINGEPLGLCVLLNYWSAEHPEVEVERVVDVVGSTEVEMRACGDGWYCDEAQPLWDRVVYAWEKDDQDRLSTARTAIEEHVSVCTKRNRVDA